MELELEFPRKSEMKKKAVIKLPIIDLSSPHLPSSTASLRQVSIYRACIEFGFFYVVNHGVHNDLLATVFGESRKFFSLPLEQKMKLSRKDFRGYTELYAEKLDTSSTSIGDSKESFYIGPLDDKACHLNQWPSSENFPDWRSTMEAYYASVLETGKKVLSLIALALNLDENFFENIGALHSPEGFLRLIHYPENTGFADEECLGASAHSDYGMITLLATNGVPGLQVCREKNRQPPVWEDVPHVEGALIVNIGDMMERWTNCLFRSTLHRVVPTGKERYSVAFFLHSPPDLLVECLPSCCSESNPPRFPPIRAGDHLLERLKLTYGDH